MLTDSFGKNVDAADKLAFSELIFVGSLNL